MDCRVSETDLRTPQKPSAVPAFVQVKLWTAAVCQPSHPAYRFDKCLNLCVILDALARLHPAADVYGIRPNPGNRLGDVIGAQTARQDNRLAQALRYQ